MREIIVGLGPLVMLTALVCGPLAGWLARTRGRNPVLWLGYGALLGPIGIVLAWFAPNSQCAVCRRPSQGWLRTCARHTPGRSADQADDAVAIYQPEVIGNWVIGPAAGGPMTRPIAMAGGMRPGPDGSTQGTDRDPVPVMITDPSNTVASGVFAGGNERLELGQRYAIERLADRVRIVGPLATTPWTVRLDVHVADLDVATVADRLLLTGPPTTGRQDLVLTFHALKGLQGHDLENALSRRPLRIAT